MTFDPASLFGAGAAGGWYDPSDPATLFQDTAATTPVTAPGQPVARINDKSGNAKHLTQATLARQPVFQVDSAGAPYLAFDGIDDNLWVAQSLPLPFDRISAFRQVGWTSGRMVFGSHAGTNGVMLQASPSPQLRLNNGGGTSPPGNRNLPIGVDGIVTERHVANASKLAVNNGAFVTGDAGAVGPTYLVIGASTATGGNASNIRFHGAIMRAGAMTDTELGEVRAWLADRANVVLSGRRAARHGYWI